MKRASSIPTAHSFPMGPAVRRQVLAHLTDLMVDAHGAGHPDPMKAAGEAFPGTPLAVLAEAWCEFDARRTEQWWQQVERTIEGEVICRALLMTEKGGDE